MASVTTWGARAHHLRRSAPGTSTMLVRKELKQGSLHGSSLVVSSSKNNRQWLLVLHAYDLVSF